MSKALLVEFLNLRGRLLQQFSELCNVEELPPSLAGIQRTGKVELDDESWSWRVHGTGVQFQNEKNVVVEAFKLRRSTRMFEKLEFEEYLESLGIQPTEQAQIVDAALDGLTKTNGRFHLEQL